MSILIHGRSKHRIRTLFLSTVEWCALSRNGYFSFSKTKTNQNKTKLPIYFILIFKKRIPKFSLSLSSKIPIITQILLQFHHFFSVSEINFFLCLIWNRNLRKGPARNASMDLGCLDLGCISVSDKKGVVDSKNTREDDAIDTAASTNSKIGKVVSLSLSLLSFSTLLFSICVSLFLGFQCIRNPKILIAFLFWYYWIWASMNSNPKLWY